MLMIRKRYVHCKTENVHQTKVVLIFIQHLGNICQILSHISILLKLYMVKHFVNYKINLKSGSRIGDNYIGIVAHVEIDEKRKLMSNN